MADKIAVMPNKAFHRFLPLVVLALLVVMFGLLSVLDRWWAIAVLVPLAMYTLVSLLGEFTMPRIALFMARRQGKLDDEYVFDIDEERIRRASTDGTIEVLWSQLQSVEFLGDNVFFNLQRGSMVIPNARLDAAQIETLARYAKRTASAAATDVPG